MKTEIISPKKLIEVALPLDLINEASAKEKGNPFLKGHPRNLHQWWARRPLAAARAVIFSQLVNDPEDLWKCQNPGAESNKQVRGHWTKARAKLFKIIEDLVIWENTTNEAVLKPAREAIRQSWREVCELNKDHPQAKDLFNPEKIPGLHDPFAGGGAIPLEAQRLGLEAFASDLNPVAVLINKAMIEIPPKFSGKPPVYPGRNSAMKVWNGATGLAEDLRFYGKWVRDEALKRIGHLYPPIEITKAMVKERPDLKPYEGQKLSVSSCLWARTIKSPNPAFSKIEVPLVGSFVLCSKPGKQAYVKPVINRHGYSFIVNVGDYPAEAKLGTKASRGSNFRCLMSDVPISADYIMDFAKKNSGLGTRLMAVVAEGVRERVYLSPNYYDIPDAIAPTDLSFLESEMTNDRRWFSPPLYGMPQWKNLFLPRQLIALSMLSDLISETRQRIIKDASKLNYPVDDRSLDDSGEGVAAYSDAIVTLMGLALDKTADYCNTICAWNSTNQNISHLFTKQAIPMTWDFAEMDPVSGALPFDSICDGLARSLVMLPTEVAGHAFQANCSSTDTVRSKSFISTDPPYYDNIGYADLSDFFYVWLRRSLKKFYPKLLATITVPKAEELVATPYRHGNADKAELFFLNGMTQAMHNLAISAHPAAPITIYYAFKQSESGEKQGTSSTGWETFLDAVLKSGLSVTGTWPMRTERAERSVGQGTNALASSIILVCRPRQRAVGTIGRRQFIRMLNEALPIALDAMTRESEGLHSPVAPVDLSQAIIGPGMAIFSRYDAVLEADGTPMTVKTALQLINRFLAEDDFDADTQFCLHWFEQHGWDAGKFGEADTLARAKGTSVAGVKLSGVIEAGGGNVRLYKWNEYDSDWEASSDARLPVWEALHQLIRAYNSDGDSGAATVLAGIGSKAEAARQLAYRLYTLSERAGRAEDARAYNEVVTGWSGIETAATKMPTRKQGTLFDNEGN